METMFGICQTCWDEAHNYDKAFEYGKIALVGVEINGLFAKILTPEQIDAALSKAVERARKGNPFRTEELAQEFLRDDDGDFADFLKGDQDD